MRKPKAKPIKKPPVKFALPTIESSIALADSLLAECDRLGDLLEKQADYNGAMRKVGHQARLIELRAKIAGLTDGPANVNITNVQTTLTDAQKLTIAKQTIAKHEYEAKRLGGKK